MTQWPRLAVMLGIDTKRGNWERANAREYMNPVGAGRIIIREGAPHTDGAWLVWDLSLALGGRLPCR